MSPPMAQFSRPRALWIFVRAVLPGPKSWLTPAIGLAVIMAATFAAFCALYPWAYSISFGATLPGTWMGELTPAVGSRHIVLIQLQSDIGEGGDDLAGKVTLCGQRDQSHEFGLNGRTRNWRGTAFEMTSFLTERRDGRGVQIASAEGNWDGRDEIRVNAHLRLFRIENGGSISSTARPPEQATLEDTPVAFTLRRSSAQAFTAACRSLPR
jgi:hypothetical protein